MIDTGAPGGDYSYAGCTENGYNVQTISADGKTVYSEMAHLFYVTLGNKAICPPGDATCAGIYPPGWGLTNTGNFQDLKPSVFWSGLEFSPAPNHAWYFNTDSGEQSALPKTIQQYAMAVRPGDVAAPPVPGIPEPETYGLMLAGLGALALARRQQRR